MSGQIEKSIGYGVGAVIIIYSLTKKIPLPCFGCDGGSFWYRCISGTGKGTESCAAHKKAGDRIAASANILDEAGVFMANLWEFTTNDLPDTIKDFIADLKDSILRLKDKVAEKIMAVISFLKEKIYWFASKVKDTAVDTYDKYFADIINPIIAFAMKNILQPVIMIFGKIMEFRNMIWKVLSDAIDKFANIPIGDFVGDVIDIFQKIPEMLELMKVKTVELINNLKNNMVETVNTGIGKTIDGIEITVNTMSDGIDTAVGGVVNGLNFVKDELIDGINDSINATAGGIEKGVNGMGGLIEQGVNRSLRGVTDGINTSTGKVSTIINDNSTVMENVVNNASGKIETGISKVVGSVNTVIAGAESVLKIVAKSINTGINKIEDGVNSVASGINSGVNSIVERINRVVSVGNKVKNHQINIDLKFIDYDFKPFNFLPSLPTAKNIDINKVNIEDVASKNFKRVNAKLDIPSLNIPTVRIPRVTPPVLDIKDLDIPTVNIKAPADIPKLDIPHIEIPELEIPMIPDINPDFGFPSIPGFGFLGEKITMVKDSVRNIFETAMAPLYDGIAFLTGLVSLVISAIVNFYNDYLTVTAIKYRIGQLVTLAGKGVDSLKRLVTDEIIPGFINVLSSIKEPVVDFIYMVSKKVWSFLKKVGGNLGTLFTNVFKATTQITKVVAKSVLATGIYIFGSTIDRATPFIPASVSVKIVVVLSVIMWITFGMFVKNIADVGKIAKGIVGIGLNGLVDLDRLVDAMAGIGTMTRSEAMTNIKNNASAATEAIAKVSIDARKKIISG